MAVLKIFKETTLPGTPEAHSVYFVAPPGNPDFVEIYVTDSSGVTKRVIDAAEVQALISSAMTSANNLAVVADIAARDALTPSHVMQVLVLDASGDATVTAGGATYVYDLANTSWEKISETESMDLSLTWAALQDKPTSSVSDIDDAVSKKHAHTNKTQLDKIDEDGNGDMTYDGVLPKTAWTSTAW